MSRMACTEPQCLYKGALYLFLSNLSVSNGSLRYAVFAQRMRNNVRECRKEIKHYFDWIHAFFHFVHMILYLEFT